MKFVVTGLPRSRTKWASVFLSTPNCPCEHDTNKGDYGISDASILLIWETLPDDIPITYIHRPLKEVIVALKDFFITESFIIDLQRRAVKMITTRKVLILDYHNFDAKALWKHCHDTAISNEYIKVYTDMNIQQQKMETLRRVA